MKQFVNSHLPQQGRSNGQTNVETPSDLRGDTPNTNSQMMTYYTGQGAVQTPPKLYASSIPHPLTEFHLFGDFPTEIRRMIIKFAKITTMSDARVPILITQYAILLTAKQRQEEAIKTGYQIPHTIQWAFHLASPTQVFRLVNHEFRDEFIKQNPCSLQLYEDGPKVFFEPEDRLFFPELSLLLLYKYRAEKTRPGSNLLKVRHPRGFGKIKHLAVEFVKQYVPFRPPPARVTMNDLLFPSYHAGSGALRQGLFPNVKTMTITVPKPLGSGGVARRRVSRSRPEIEPTLIYKIDRAQSEMEDSFRRHLHRYGIHLTNKYAEEVIRDLKYTQHAQGIERLFNKVVMHADVKRAWAKVEIRMVEDAPEDDPEDDDPEGWHGA